MAIVSEKMFCITNLNNEKNASILILKYHHLILKYHSTIEQWRKDPLSTAGFAKISRQKSCLGLEKFLKEKFLFLSPFLL